MLAYARVCVRVRARVFGESMVALHHPQTFLSPPLSWPPAWVNAEAPSLHLLVAPFVCQPNPALELSPSYSSPLTPHEASHLTVIQISQLKLVLTQSHLAFAFNACKKTQTRLFHAKNVLNRCIRKLGKCIWYCHFMPQSKYRITDWYGTLHSYCLVHAHVVSGCPVPSFGQVCGWC